MHAAFVILRKIVRPVSAYLDLRNARNVLLAAQALAQGRRLTLMELARHWPGAQRVAGPLKRLDRLLGNAQVQAVRTRFYSVTAAWLMRSAQPVLVVDWSELKSDGRWHLLRAGLVARGRTISVYEEVHPEAKKNSRAVQAAFLRRLRLLLPPGVCPIVVTDAGFQNPWFSAVQACGWHWIGRIRHRTHVRLEQEAGAWIGGKALHRRAGSRACSLGRAWLARSNSLECRLVLVRRRARGRVALTRAGVRARGGRDRKMALREREPWLLAASRSLEALAPAHIVTLYAKRMQIEQSFRDLKSHRYGCAFEDTLTRTGRRLEVLLLIHMLASLAAWLAAAANSANSAQRVCAPSLATRYSSLWIGWASLRYGLPTQPDPPSYSPAPLLRLLAMAT